MMKTQEQWGDLSWARDVLAGNGDELDDATCALNMLETLMIHGHTSKIRQTAGSIHASCMKVAA